MSKVKLVVIVGAARSGTSKVAKEYIDAGYICPKPWQGRPDDEYETYESVDFSELCQNWSKPAARRLIGMVNSGIEGDKVVLKLPSAVKIIGRFLKLAPDTKVVYCYRPLGEYLWACRKRYYEHMRGGDPHPWVPMWCKLLRTTGVWLRAFVITWSLKGYDVSMVVFRGK